VRRLTIGLLLLLVLFTFGVNAQDFPYDLGGKTIRIQTRWEDVTPLGERGDHNWYEPDARLQAHIESVEKLFNCKIEFVVRGSEGDAFAAIKEGALSGEQPVHFAHFAAATALLASQDLIQPLDDVLEPDFYDDFPEMFQYDWFTGDEIGSSIYGFESMSFSRSARLLMWNKSLFEREGLESLYDIYERGDWTWDKFAEICHALTKDTTGDGEFDQIGLGGFHRIMMFDWIVSNGAKFAHMTEDGRLEFDLLRPEVVETFDFMQKLWQDGVWRNVDRSQVGMEIINGLHMASPSLQNWFADQSDEWGLIPLPKGPNGKGNAVGLHDRWLGTIPIYVENPREVIEIVCALFQAKAPYIEDLEEWEANFWDQYSWAMYDVESFEYLKWAIEHSILMPSQIEARVMLANASPNAEAVFKQIVQEGASPTSTLAAWQPMLQGILDEMLKQ